METRGRAKLAPAPAEETAEGAHPNGTLLCLDDEELVIYRRPVSGQSYDMVYSLLADGSVKIEAVELAKHHVSVLGQMPSLEMKTLQTGMRWNRALVAPGCLNAADAGRIPEPDGATATAPSPQPPQKESRSAPAANQPPLETASRVEPPPGSEGKTKIRRGQRLALKFGDKTWEAVYWGQDQKGTVVAHSTHKRWSLMHLDLSRFKETMILQGEPDPQLVDEIMQELAKKTPTGH
jgi:hypothetical protein